MAANNPGTGDSGFFTFRPSAGVGGTQVNVASGNALVRTRDLADGPLTYHVVVDRFYNSLDPDSYTILSPRWGFDVGPDSKLTVESNQDATVRGPSGYRIRFGRQADGSYVAPEGFDGSLVKTPSGWTLARTSASDEFGFDGSGNLTWTKDSSLRDFTVQGTSAAGRTVLSSYGTNSGRRVNLSYTTSGDYFVRLMDNPASGHHWYRYSGGRLSEYESPTGAITSYGYDSNGFLDEIVEPGGTTVELDVLSSGKISSITTTLPGGVPQTTSFVYARRTFKSDVTAPDTTRRTYAYDDDWRVTRHYNPDVVPTVTASGELRDLADDYVGPNRTYPLTVAADQPDGAGLRRLLVERSNGTEIEGEDVPCTTTPFDLVCPTQRTTDLDVSFVDVAEGEQTIRAAAKDDEEHHATSDGWNVLVDKTAPISASDFELSYFDPSDSSASATITWEMPADPALPGGIPGAGIQATEARYRIDSGPWSSWIDSDSESTNEAGEDEVSGGSLTFFGGQSGGQITVEVRTTDRVGNVSSATGTVALAERLEDPQVETMAIDYFVDEFGTTRPVAQAWLRVQRDAIESEAAVTAVVPSDRYASMWFDNQNRRVKFGVTTTSAQVDATAALASTPVASHSDVVVVDHSQGEIIEGQRDLHDELEGLLDEGVVSLSRDPEFNRVHVEVAGDATASQRAQISTAVGLSSVNAVVVNGAWESDDFELDSAAPACGFRYCDGPLIGGLGIGDGQAEWMYEFQCTSGFVARTTDGGSKPAVTTAGHCVRNREWWATKSADSSEWFRVGTRDKWVFGGGKGDVGRIVVSSATDDDWFGKKPGRTRAEIFMRASTTGSTTRNTRYGIRDVWTSRKGWVLCASGARTGARCLKVDKLGEEWRPGAQPGQPRPPLLRNLGRGKACGSGPGDSGGPIVLKGLAFGTVVGRSRRASDCRMFFHGALSSEEDLDIRILRRR